MLSSGHSMASGEGVGVAHGARLDQRVGDHTPPAGDTRPGAMGDEVPRVNPHKVYSVRLSLDVTPSTPRRAFTVEPVGRSLAGLNYSQRRRARKLADEAPCAACGHLTHLNNPDGQCGWREIGSAERCTCVRYISPAVRL